MVTFVLRGPDSIGKQKSRQAKWSHTLVSTAGILKDSVLGAPLYNCRKSSQPLQQAKKK